MIRSPTSSFARSSVYYDRSKRAKRFGFYDENTESTPLDDWVRALSFARCILKCVSTARPFLLWDTKSDRLLRKKRRKNLFRSTGESKWCGRDYFPRLACSAWTVARGPWRDRTYTRGMIFRSQRRSYLHTLHCDAVAAWWSLEIFRGWNFVVHEEVLGGMR